VGTFIRSKYKKEQQYGSTNYRITEWVKAFAAHRMVKDDVGVMICSAV